MKDWGSFYEMESGVRWYKDVIHHRPDDLLIYHQTDIRRGHYILIDACKIEWGTLDDCYDGRITDAVFSRQEVLSSHSPLCFLDEFAERALSFKVEKNAVKEKTMGGRMLRPVVDEATAKIMKEEEERLVAEKILAAKKLSEEKARRWNEKKHDALAKILGSNDAKKDEVHPLDKLADQGRNPWHGVRTVTTYDIPKGYRVVGGKAVRESDKAIFFQKGGITKWLPKSQLVLTGEVYKEIFLAPNWLMNKSGWDV